MVESGGPGAFVGSRRPKGRLHDPAIAATLREAAAGQVERGRIAGGPLILRPSDLREKVRARPARHLVLFVVDASRSMGARERIRQTKAAVLSLLIDAYQRRDRVGLITFGRGGARLALPPTRSVQVAARCLDDLPIGGATPLAAALELTLRVVGSARRREPGVWPLVVLLTDGRGNLPLGPGGHPLREALGLAARLGAEGVDGLVVDTETGPVLLGQARALAESWGAKRSTLEELRGSIVGGGEKGDLLADWVDRTRL